MPTYREVLHQAIKELEDNNIYAESAQVYLLELTRENNIDLYSDYDYEIDKGLYDTFLKGLERLKKDEPLGYVLGYTWFYGRKFKVNNDVLIPRPETEELCANVLSMIDEYYPKGKISCVDIGTGSGEIAITLALEESRIKMNASDISKEALNVAIDNAKVLNADVEFRFGDMLKPWIKDNYKFDILISDPPYIPINQKIDNSVKSYEPHVALFGGEDGLKFYHHLLSDADKVMKDKGIIAFEIGYDQKDALLKLVNYYLPNCKAEVLKDIAGKDRMLFVYYRK